MKDRIEIKKIFADAKQFDDKKVKVGGWVKTIRESKAVCFMEINDGIFKNAQIVFDEKLANFEDIKKLSIGSSVLVLGTVKLTPEALQPFEIIAEEIEIQGVCAGDYPFQKKGHTLEYLREHCYIRPRTNIFNAVFRIRSECAFAIHQFFNQKGFVYVNTPIITSSDCEGAGEMFQATTLDLGKIKDGNPDYKRDFFGKKVHLTVSGQLNEECFTHCFCNTYNFGPTFRAENSNTSRHAAEFWMMEPEMCFAELDDVMQNEEEMLKFVINHILCRCKDELEFLNKFVDKTLLDRLNHIATSEFVKLDYTKAIEILQNCDKKFEYPVSWGTDLQSEHERYLTEEVYKKPVFLMNYPKEIKSFYMRLNEDGKTVAAVDLLVPGVGELMGGSQREERLDVLLERMKECNLKEEDYWWYVNLRKFGTVKHGGYGLGFERLIMYVTGITNIRDVEAFPRTVGKIDF